MLEHSQTPLYLGSVLCCSVNWDEALSGKTCDAAWASEPVGFTHTHSVCWVHAASTQPGAIQSLPVYDWDLSLLVDMRAKPGQKESVFTEHRAKTCMSVWAVSRNDLRKIFSATTTQSPQLPHYSLSLCSIVQYFFFLFYNKSLNSYRCLHLGLIPCCLVHTSSAWIAHRGAMMGT